MKPAGNQRPIVITGGTGQVGSELVRMLPDHRVVAPKRSELDLADPDSIRACVRRLRPSLIINSGAYTAVDKAESEQAVCLAVNAEAPRVLAEEAAALSAPIMHFSTDYVFDGVKPAPYIEDDPTRPLSVYGKTKEQGERNVRKANAAAIILRCSWIYSMEGTNFLRTMLRLRNEKDNLRIVDDQTGAPTWAREIANAAVTIIRSAKNPPNDLHQHFLTYAGTYHLTAAGSTTWKEFAEQIFAVTDGKRPSVVGISSSEYGAPAPRPRNSILDNSKIADAFGIRLASWQEQLKACVAAA